MYLFEGTHPDSLVPEELRLVDERYGDDDDVDVSELMPPVLMVASKGLEYVLTKGRVTCVFRFAKSETVKQNKMFSQKYINTLLYTN